MIDFLRKILGKEKTLAPLTLYSINSIDKLRNLLGMPVYSVEGEVLGRINKIVVSKRERRAKQVFIKVKHGIAEVKPEDLLIIKERVVYVGDEELRDKRDMIIIGNNKEVNGNLGQIDIDEFIRFLKG
ncbi:MAG: hypothetical protein DRJ41_01715 [Thermoprotei archaeon]|nr:MAG: hypothetical protein DRJ41_01715 [Thermoprotei archaeon]HDI31623.1 hypothetical protein [Thermofilum sp.]